MKNTFKKSSAVPFLFFVTAALFFSFFFYMAAAERVSIYQPESTHEYHVLLIVSVVSVPLAALYNRIMYKYWGLLHSWRLLFLLIAGIGIDLVHYYLHNNTGPLSFSIIFFIIYMLIIFLRGVLDATQKAYTDNLTGLMNRNKQLWYIRNRSGS